MPESRRKMKSKITTNPQFKSHHVLHPKGGQANGGKVQDPKSNVLRVLILEDVPADAELVKRELKKAEIAFTSKLVNTRDAFLRELEKFAPDLVLSDYSIPRFNGMEAVKLVKKRLPSIPIIIVTDTINEETAVECMKAGADDYVIKENLNRLGRAVAIALEKKQLRKAKQTTEEALQRSETKFRLLLKNLPSVVYRGYIDGSVEFFDNKIELLTGYSADEFNSQKIKWLELIIEQDIKATRDSFIRALKSDRSYVREYRIQPKAGDICWIQERGQIVSDDRGRIEYVSGVLFDITESKKYEKALQEQKEKYQNLIQHANDAIFVLQDDKIKFSNPKTEEMTGYSSAELSKMSLAQFMMPPDRSSLLDKQERLQKEEKLTSTHSFRVINRYGKDLWAQLSMVSIKWEGQPATLNFLRDVTQEKGLEKQLLQSQKMEAIGTLAGGIAHDFNNILTTIIGNAFLALNEISKNTPLHETVAEIRQAGEKAATLTRQLLTFSRKQTIQPMILNLNESLVDIEKMIRRMIAEDIELTIAKDPGLWLVNIDPGQIEQVIINLVVNAKDAMPQGGKLMIETSNIHLDEGFFYDKGIKELAGPYVYLSVADTGVGMDAKTRSQIFDPFFTTKPKGQGTGLGLSTVYGIVKQNQGFIWTDSAPGQGAVFNIYLPQATRKSRSEKKGKVPAKQLVGSETVLIVEDDNMLLNMALKALKRYGYKALGVGDPQDALRHFEDSEDHIDLIVIDVVMPGMSGPEMVERIQSLKPSATVKVIYMSGYMDEKVGHHGVLASGENFLGKPFSPEKLIGKVRQVLDQDYVKDKR